MKHLLIFISALLLCQISMAKSQGDFKEVDLKEFTSLKLYVMPDQGLQLIFPFMLDNPELTPKLKIQNTNSDVFAIPALEQGNMDKLFQGQNTISIVGNPINIPPGSAPPVFRGNLFINIGGFNLKIVLITTYDTTVQSPNIIFNITDEQRDHMIEAAVKRKTENLDKQHKERLAAVDQLAKEQSLKHISVMATYKPDSVSFKEDGDIVIDRHRLVVFADELVSYGDEYHVLIFELDNKSSSDFTIQNLELYGIGDDEYEKKLKGSFSCKPRLNADVSQTCSFATLSNDIKKALRLRLNIITDRGEGTFTW